MLIDINNAYERAVQLIMQTDGRWQWDDANQPTTDQGDGTGGLAIATATVTANQQDYQFAVSHLVLTRVEIKDTGGVWTKLNPFDEEDLQMSLTEFMKTAGQPIYYDKKGTSLILYPKPNYTQSASLKVYFQRPPILYTSAEVTTGTKVPGFNSLYHMLIPYYVAYEWHIDKDEPRKAQLRLADIVRLEDNLKGDYQMRADDEPLVLRTRVRNKR